MSMTFLPPRRERGREPSGFEFPGPRDRVTINGKTGSGKSTFGMWLFSECADFEKKPWIVIDYKRETLVQRAVADDIFQSVKITDAPPRNPGVYVVTPDPKNTSQIVDYLWSIYRRGQCGVYLDEATMIPELRGDANSGGPFQTLLSQGRSLNIPVWTISQRPAFINRMAFTESDFYCAFRLKSEDDEKKVLKEIRSSTENYNYVWGHDWLDARRAHWSRWYDDKRGVNYRLRPCPPEDEILDILFGRIDNLKKRASL